MNVKVVWRTWISEHTCVRNEVTARHIADASMLCVALVHDTSTFNIEVTWINTYSVQEWLEKYPTLAVHREDLTLEERTNIEIPE